MQQGGNALPPLVSYQPVINAGAARTQQTTAPESKKSDSDLTDKDLLKMLEKLDGLPSDINLITTSLQNFYIDQQYNPYPNTSNIASRYLQILNQLNTAKFNRTEYDEAFKIASSTGGINEIAINERGQIICQNAKDFKDFKLLSPEQLKNQDTYIPLTNSELLNKRAYNPELAMNNQLTKIVQNSIGVPALTSMINNIISNLGSSSMASEGYAAKESGRIINGINLLRQAVLKGVLDKGLSNLSVDGLYKNDLLTKEQTQQARAALDYIYNVLPENAKSLLKIKSDGTNKGVQQMLLSLISSKINNTVDFNTDLQEDLHTDGSKISEKELTDKSKINPAVAFQRDMGAETLLPINAGNNESLVIQAYRMPVTTKDGAPIGVTTLDKIANESALGGIFDFSHVTMGDQVLDMSSLSKIAIDGSSIFKVYLPYDQTKAAQGIITPNLNYLALLQKVRQEVKETNATEPEQINTIYEKYNLPQFMDLEGNVNEDYYKPFGVLNGTALSDAFNTNVATDTNNFEEIFDENIINNTWEIIKGKDSKEQFDSKGFFNYLGIGDYQQMFKGLVYLPLNSIDPTLGAYSGGDQPSESTIYNNKKAWQQDQRTQQYKPQGQLQL